MDLLIWFRRRVVSFAMVPLATAFASPPPQGSLGHWPFEETSGLTAANLHVAARPMTVAATTWEASGRLGRALGLAQPGSMGRFQAPNPTAFTVSVWLRPTNLTSSTFPRLFALPGAELMIDAAAARFQFEVRHVTDSARWRTAPGAVPVGAWTHVAATYDGSTARLFLNGAEAVLSVLSPPQGARTAVGDLGFLGNRSDGLRPFAGLLDEATFHERALTPAEIALLAGAGPPVPDPSAGAPAIATELRLVPRPTPLRRADTDGDGSADLLETAAGTPVRDAALAPVVVPVSVGPSSLEFRYGRRTDQPHLRTWVEASSDLASWTTSGVEQRAAVRPIDAGREEVIARATGMGPNRYARLRAEDTRQLRSLDPEALRHLFSLLLAGYQAQLNPSRTRSAAQFSDYQHVTRTLWALGAWFSQPGRPRTLPRPDGSVVDVAALLLDALRHGTDPAHPDRWPLSSGPWEQIVVEAPQIGWSVWAAGRGYSAQTGQTGHPWAELSPQHLANVHAFLRDQDQSVYPHNWGLFVAANQAVRRALHRQGVAGFSASYDETVLGDRLRRSQLMHHGEGWHTDSSISPSTPTFDDYNSWGYILFHLVILAYTADDPEPATVIPGLTPARGRRELLADFRRFFAQQAHFVDAHGAFVEYGRSQTYKFARLSALTLAYALDRLYNTPERWNLGFSLLPDTIPPGALRRMVRLHLNHYLALGMVEPSSGRLLPGSTPDSAPAVQEGYILPGSTYWAMSLFAGLWLLPDQDPLWSAAEVPLPAEQGDFSLWIQPTGFLLSHRAEDDHVELFNTRVHKTTTTGSDYDGKYENFTYSSAVGGLVAGGPRHEQNLMLGSSWRREPSGGDRWNPAPERNDPAVILRSNHTQGGRAVQTVMFIRDGLQVRVHRISGGGGSVRAREGGYALGRVATEPAGPAASGPDWVYLEGSTGAVFTARLLGYTETTVASGVGGHARSPAWSLGTHENPAVGPGTVLATLHRASRHALDPAATRSRVAEVRVEGNVALVFWGDGLVSAAPFRP